MVGMIERLSYGEGIMERAFEWYIYVFGHTQGRWVMKLHVSCHVQLHDIQPFSGVLAQGKLDIEARCHASKQ